MTLNVIDSHFHIWDPDAQDLPWLAGLPSLQHKYTIEDLAAQYAKFGVNFLGGVYVEVDAADHELEDRLLYENASPLILKRMLQGRISHGCVFRSTPMASGSRCMWIPSHGAEPSNPNSSPAYV